MEAIIKLDTALFYAINTGLTSSFLDALMPFITEKSNFLVVILAAVVFIIARGSRKEVLGLAILVVAVLTSDFLSNGFKNVFLRVRPCHALEGVNLLVGCGGSYSFPSGHATNIFTAMVFLSWMYRKLAPLFILVAISVAYSRVYVGVHYPIDIIGGAVLGSATAAFFIEADRRWLKTLFDYIKNKRDSLEA
jgi:undecaprenyl-diphosphatase